MWDGAITFRCEENASHIRNKNNIAPIKEIKDPIEETVFHVV